MKDYKVKLCRCYETVKNPKIKRLKQIHYSIGLVESATWSRYGNEKNPWTCVHVRVRKVDPWHTPSQCVRDLLCSFDLSRIFFWSCSNFCLPIFWSFLRKSSKRTFSSFWKCSPDRNTEETPKEMRSWRLYQVPKVRSLWIHLWVWWVSVWFRCDGCPIYIKYNT